MGTGENLKNFLKLANFNLKQMWNFVKKEFWPIKGANYFLENILLNEKIAEDKRNGYFMYLIFVFLILSLILSVVQYFYHDHRTFMLLTFDYFGLNNFPLNIKISKAIINISTFCFYKFMYFDLGKTKYFPQFKNVFIENNRAFVLGSRTKFMKWIVWNLRFYQVLVVALELWLIGIYIQFGLALSVHTFGSIYRWCLAYLCMSIFFVIFSATFSIFCVGGFAGGVALSTIFVIFERVKIGSSRYLHQPVSRFTTARLLRYRRENVQTLDHLFGFSSHYGNLLVTFLWTNIPSNVSFIAILLLGNEFSVFVYFFCIVAVIGESCNYCDEKILKIPKIAANLNCQSLFLLLLLLFIIYYCYYCYYCCFVNIFRSDNGVDILPPCGRLGHQPNPSTVPSVSFSICSQQEYQPGEPDSVGQQH